RSAGTFACPKLSLSGPGRAAPHATTRPVLVNAMLWYIPAETATTSVSPLGTSVCPYSSDPHATTVLPALEGGTTGAAAALPAAPAATSAAPASTTSAEPHRQGRPTGPTPRAAFAAS